MLHQRLGARGPLANALVLARTEGMDPALREGFSRAGPPAAPGSDPNAASVVILVRHSAFSALLTGDAPSQVEEDIVDAAGLVQVLKVGHHGSATSSSMSFLEGIRPAVALVSAGRGNPFGHPNRTVLDRLERVGARVLRTDLHGTVRVRGWGDGSWTVSAQRPD